MWLLDGIVPMARTDVRVTDLTLDSRAVRPGSLFLALGGGQSHGLQFAAEAAARGATVILWEPAGGAQPPALSDAVFLLCVPKLRQLAGRIADRFFNSPSAHLSITGITGTNGKTTCAYVLAQALVRLGVDASYMGTLGSGRTAALDTPTHTTPDVVTVHRRLAEMRAAGNQHVCMEVSSHALQQDRVAAVRFHTAAFTNLSRDHLDYHGSMTAYGEAKARLFAVPDLKHVVLNVDDAFGRTLAQRCGSQVPLTAVWIGERVAAGVAELSLKANGVRAERHGLTLELDGSYGQALATTPLLGHFNAENTLVVLACLLGFDFSLQDAVRAVAQCHAAPGRMEIIAADPSRPTTVVDYAHTPDALEKALRAARAHCDGVLWCVFGCGGDRDPGKRPLMGAVADAWADEIIVTDDNPRSEDPAAIVREILAGITARRPQVIHDRGAAIGRAIAAARAADLVLIAGKGHEEYQIYGETRRPFSDRREAQRHLGVAA